MYGSYIQEYRVKKMHQIKKVSINDKFASNVFEIPVLPVFIEKIGMSYNYIWACYFTGV